MLLLVSCIKSVGLIEILYRIYFTYFTYTKKLTKAYWFSGGGTLSNAPSRDV